MTTVGKLAAAAGAVLVALALLVVLGVSSRRRGTEAYCRNNLRHLGRLAVNNWTALDPEKTGRSFWQQVREAQYRNVRGEWQPIAPDPFVCPVHGRTASNPREWNSIDYRGPGQVREDFRQTPKGEPIGADREGNHSSGGNVLRLDTSVDEILQVERAGGKDALWDAAAKSLKD